MSKLTHAQNAQAKAFAQDAARIALERHCRNVVVLDLKGASPATDFFVIATGTSDRQMRTVADEVSVAGKQAGFEYPAVIQEHEIRGVEKLRQLPEMGIDELPVGAI